MQHCRICGSTAFKPGHAGRTAIGGALPTCANCGSTERHRIIHAMYEALKPLTQQWRALQFAPDGSLARTNFKALDVSIYGGVNSLDMMQTGLPDGSYELVASNHVLEHVKDHLRAIQESLRLVGPKGVVHVCVPSPAQVVQTRDWGFADPSLTYHYRIYGADAGVLLGGAHDDAKVLCGVGRDAVTDTYDMVYWLSLDRGSLVQMTGLLQRARFAVVCIR